MNSLENKEFLGDSYNGYIKDEDVAVAVDSAFPSFGSATALQPRRHKRGILEDCCKQPCSYEVLLTYCAE